MSNKQTLSAQLSEESPLYEDFQEYRQDFESKSEAVRSALRKGVEAEQTDPLDERPDSPIAGLMWDARRDVHTFVLAGAVCFLVAQLVSGVVGFGFLALAGCYALTVTIGTIDSLLLDSALLRRVKAVEAAAGGRGVEA